MTLPLPYQLETALKHLDSLFPLFPDFDSFKIEDLISDFNRSNPGKKIPLELRTAFERLLKDKLEYISVMQGMNLRFELTKLGREVKGAGGHFAYLQKLQQEKELARRKETADLLTKEWIYKTRLFPYIVSLLALTVSIFGYFKEPKKEQSKTLSNSQLTQPLPKSDTLHKVDIPMKTGSK